MAWSSAVVVNGGLNMLNQSAGIILDYAAGGTGAFSTPALMAQTALKNQKQVLPIVDIREVEHGKKLNILVSNKGLTVGYKLQQIGIWAHTGDEPSKLFAILQDDSGIAVPTETEVADFSLNFYAVIKYSGEASFSLSVDPSALVSQGDMQAAINDAVERKQDKLTGTKGQIAGFDAEGKLVAQDQPESGVSSFNGRKGAVMPKQGDYTAEDVGAVPTSRKVNGKPLSSDINLGASDVGAAAASHGTHVSYSTTAPVMDGTASAGSAATVARSDHKHPTDTSRAAANHTHTAADVGAVPTTRKVNGKALSSDITLAAADVGAADSSHTHPAQTTVSGNAGTATKLATARTIDGVSFNGSAAIIHYGTCDTAAATAAKVVALTGFTLVTGAKVAVKFAVTNTAANPTLNVNSTGAKAIYYRGAAITAGYLAANRTYEFVYNGTQYELVGDVNTNTTYAAASAAPLAAGTAAVGTSAKYAREDHVHPAQTSVTGNAGTATKLKTARKIGSADFDGSANITLADIGAAASGHTHTAADVGARQMEIVSRAGTGTSGADNPCSITFSFAPEVVLIVGHLKDSHWHNGSGINKIAIMYIPVMPTVYTQHFGFNSTGSSSNSGVSYAKKSSDGKTISWYWIFMGSSGADPVQAQFNLAGATYYFLAIG